MADLEVEPAQAAFVALVSRYLAMCAFGDSPWEPLAVTVETGVVSSRAQQGRGYGRAIVRALIELARAEGCTGVALSYGPGNARAAASMHGWLSGKPRSGRTTSWSHG